MLPDLGGLTGKQYLMDHWKTKKNGAIHMYPLVNRN